MATTSTLSVLSTPNLVPKIGSRNSSSCKLNFGALGWKNGSLFLHGFVGSRLNAGLSEIEPDLNEDPKDRWATNGVSPEEFQYGKWDGHHTYHEGVDEEEGTFWGLVARDYEAVGPPTGFQGLISWLFPPAVVAAMYFQVPGEYLYIGAAIFTIIFCIIEMDKPSEAHNFEPQIYNLDRGLREKLISDYNSMSIWEFNEKYGELWDFTVKNDDIIKR